VPSWFTRGLHPYGGNLWFSDGVKSLEMKPHLPMGCLKSSNKAQTEPWCWRRRRKRADREWVCGRSRIKPARNRSLRAWRTHILAVWGCRSSEKSEEIDACVVTLFYLFILSVWANNSDDGLIAVICRELATPCDFQHWSICDHFQVRYYSRNNW
jgi:hypothetical protein